MLSPEEHLQLHGRAVHMLLCDEYGLTGETCLVSMKKLCDRENVRTVEL